jgi:hypothetical protein
LTGADDTSVQELDQSCHEFKELMVSGNRLMFLRSNQPPNTINWKAVLCLNCNKERESGLLKVTSFKDKSIDWFFKPNDFLAIKEILSPDDDLQREIPGMHTILSDVRTKCHSYLTPINEGSHLELAGNAACIRHEYFRLYLKRKFKLTDYSYTELESKKDLSKENFYGECHQILSRASDKNLFSETYIKVVIALKQFLGSGLGDYDPVVSRDSKSFQREIATESPKSK